MNKSTDDFYTYNSTNSDSQNKSERTPDGYKPDWTESWVDPNMQDDSDSCNCSNPYCQV